MKEMIEARRIACPIWDLDDWVLEHHDVVTLCRGFDCPECVADPEDLPGGCCQGRRVRAQTRKSFVHGPERNACTFPKLGLD